MIKTKEDQIEKWAKEKNYTSIYSESMENSMNTIKTILLKVWSVIEFMLPSNNKTNEHDEDIYTIKTVTKDEVKRIYENQNKVKSKKM